MTQRLLRRRAGFGPAKSTSLVSNFTAGRYCVAHFLLSLTGPTTMSSSVVRRRGSIDVVDAKVAVDLATAQTYKENVFLFVPNLIGESTFPYCLIARSYDISILRILADYPSRFSPAFYELPSKVLHACVLRLMSSRRCRRPCSSSTRTIVEIWSSIGHGDRSVRGMYSTCIVNGLTLLAGVPHHRSYAIWPRLIRTGRWQSRDL